LAKADSVVVETQQYRAVLSSYGGGPVSMQLKEYTYRDGVPVEMLPEPNLATPAVTFAGGTFNTSRISFTSDRAPGQYDATREPFEITYTYAPESGGQIERTFVFYPDQLDFQMSLKVDDPAAMGFERSYKLVWNTPLDPTEPDAKSDYQSMEAAAMMGGSRVTLDDFDDGVMRETREGDVTWAGVRSKYFAAAFIPLNRHAEGVFADGTKRDVVLPEGEIEERKITAGITMPFASLSPIADSFTVFVGPLDYMLMADYDVDLEDMLGIGTTPYVGWLIKPFAVAIMWIMPKLYSVIPNYGIVIILFALLVKLVTLPLSMRSFKSMQAMKYLQPKIEEMKKRYKKDPQRMNQEMMKMYKEHGVNPMSGCLWVIPQMPLFFALFSVFRSTIMLRDAPFVWFINDLSRGAQSLTDPYIVLVILMVGAQFISGKLTMGTGQQNKMFAYLMPLMMGFIFYRFAAGLVLYWTTFSFLSMLDYALFKRPKNTEVKTT
jgi:YidC/Oxa1 family membrane protein insertase